MPSSRTKRTKTLAPPTQSPRLATGKRMSGLVTATARLVSPLAAVAMASTCPHELSWPHPPGAWAFQVLAVLTPTTILPSQGSTSSPSATCSKFTAALWLEIS